MKILLIAYDNDSHISFFPIGLAYIAAAIRNAGHSVTIYNQDIYHWDEQHLIEYIDSNEFDAVGVGACGGYYQYRKIKKISDAVNSTKNRPKLILGGHLPSPDPKFFLKKMGADCVCVGESEITIVELLAALESGGDLSKVSGIAYMLNNEYFRSKDRELIKNIDDIAFPAYDLFPMEHYVLTREANIKRSQRSVPILSGRGCTFKCNFCYRMDKGFRPRSAKAIIEEIMFLKENYNVNYFAFQDELLMNSVDRTIELCNAFIDSGLNISWSCNGRLNYAKANVLELMREAGCVFINYGIESLDDQALKNMKKSLTTKQITTGIENTLEAGISPGFNIIFGNIGENKEILNKGADFLIKYDDHSQLRTIRPVTPYPGSPLFDMAIEKGYIKDVEDFYENKHVNSDLLTVNFTDMTDEEYYEALHEANLKLLNNYYDFVSANIRETLDNLYKNRDASFRGFRTV